MHMMRRVAGILGPPEPGDRASHVFNTVLVWLIALNAVALVLESVPGLAHRYGHVFFVVEALSVTIFGIEYLLRLWSAPHNPAVAGRRHPRLAWAASPLGLIDLAAVLPFVLPFVGADLRFLRTVRLMRIFRLMKLARYSHAIRTFEEVFRAKREELAVILSFLAIMVVCAASAMYALESDAQPEVFPHIPGAMWWAIVTLTTIGYGDAVPITAAGRLIGGLLAVFGIGLFALPAGMLGAAFTEAIGRKQEEAREPACPHCGRSGAVEDERSAEPRLR